MKITLLEQGWLAKDDTLPWTINGIAVDPATRTRREEYWWAESRCVGNLVLDAATGYIPTWHELPAILTRKQAGRMVVALDMDPRSLDMPQTPAVLRLLGDIERLPFADSSFDTTCCISTLEHLSLPQQQRALKELLRVTTKRLLLTADEAGWLPALFGMPQAEPADGGLSPEVFCMALEIER